MKKLFGLFVLILLFSTSIIASDIISYSKKLKADGKNVMFILGSKNCPYCEVLKKDLNTNKELSSLIKGKMNVYYIPIDEQQSFEIGDKTPPVKTTSLSLKMQFGSRVTPTIVMFDKGWNRLIQLPGYTDPKHMKAFLKYVNTGLYKDKDFGEYLKEEGIL